MDQSGHESDSGDPRTRDNEQRKAECNAQRLQHVDSQHSGSEKRRQRTVHVPS